MQTKELAPASRPLELHHAASAKPASRRLAARTGFRGRGTVELPGNLSRDVEMHDLSRDGLSVMTSKPIAPGTRCTISFELPLADQASARLTVHAKTVYSSYTGADAFRVGMTFTELDGETQHRIGEFLR